MQDSLEPAPGFPRRARGEAPVDATATCQFGQSTLKMIFNIQSVTAPTMTFNGTYEQDGISKDISSTLTKISVPLDKLPELIAGTWNGYYNSGNTMFADMTRPVE